MWCICECCQRNGVERKKGTQMLCLSWYETDQVALRGPAESTTHTCISRMELWRWILLWFLHKKQIKNSDCITCCQNKDDTQSWVLIHTVCPISADYHACHWMHHLLLQQMWQSHTQSLSRSYTPKSLRLLQLGATIKTVVALVTILKRPPSDWSRHIQSCGQILFIKRAKTSAQLLLLKAPTMRAFCVLGNTRQGQTVIITRGCAFFCGKLFPN